MNNGSFSTGGQAQNPSFGTVVVTAALQLNAGAVFDLYNTADKTTNYERLRAEFASNIAQIYTQYAGTGSARNVRIGTGSGVSIARYMEIIAASASTSRFGFVGSDASSSGTHEFFNLEFTANQSATAAYTGIDLNVTETATGSGTKLLQRWAVGGVTQALIGNTGGLQANGAVLINGVSFGASLGASDTILAREAANTLALRNSTNAQTFRGYETFTDASNYSRWYQSFSGGFAYYGTQAAGTGTRRPLIVQHFTTTLAALPTAATAGAGSRAVVSDATAPVFGAAVVGGGAVVSPVYSDGANWIVG